MKKPIQAFVLAMVIAGIACTGAFAAGPQEKPDTPDKKPGGTETSLQTPEQRPQSSPAVSRDETRRQKDKVVREFQTTVRSAERRFKQDEKAASKLQGPERKAAMQKAARKMKSSIEAAREKKDAAMQTLEPHNSLKNHRAIQAKQRNAREKARAKARAARAEEKLKREEQRQRDIRQN